MKQFTLLISMLLVSILCCTDVRGADIPDNEIRYTTNDGKVVQLYHDASFGAGIVSKLTKMELESLNLTRKYKESKEKLSAIAQASLA